MIYVLYLSWKNTAFISYLLKCCGGIVWRYQMSNYNLLIKEGQTTQWSKEKGQNDKQRSTKHYSES
jgi:hypothetical protein